MLGSRVKYSFSKDENDRVFFAQEFKMTYLDIALSIPELDISIR